MKRMRQYCDTCQKDTARRKMSFAANENGDFHPRFSNPKFSSVVMQKC